MLGLVSLCVDPTMPPLYLDLVGNTSWHANEGSNRGTHGELARSTWQTENKDLRTGPKHEPKSAPNALETHSASPKRRAQIVFQIPGANGGPETLPARGARGGADSWWQHAVDLLRKGRA